jgi:hypothetical protein
MKKSIALAAGIIALSAFGSASAALVSGSGTISHIWSYSTYGSGDVVFQLTTTLSGCSNGLWLKAADPGFKNLYAMLLAAYHAGGTISVDAFNDDLWTGAGGATCRVHDVGN